MSKIDEYEIFRSHLRALKAKAYAEHAACIAKHGQIENILQKTLHPDYPVVIDCGLFDD